ncbi:hypothetical protein [Endobacterium cereale]|uniref:hypothetical protein n=1 Tax=Endobacterium cereale TaxID=2663029 RepID=UPI001F18B991|nr:hypothetical protein [Endobacterium cereale]MEB2846358.1 hypothetical protein [Endobacterium cereale]
MRGHSLDNLVGCIGTTGGTHLADAFLQLRMIYADPDNVAFAAYHSSRNGQWQNPVYKNEEVDKLIEAARVETDETKRAELYKKFQELVIDDAPDIFGVLEKRKLGFGANVKNFVFTPVAANAIELLPLSLD